MGGRSDSRTVGRSGGRSIRRWAGARRSGSSVRPSDRPTVRRYPRRVREVSERQGHHHRVPRLSGAQRPCARCRGDPRDLRDVRFCPANDRAGRQGRLRRARARPPVAPRRHAGFDRRRAQADRRSQPDTLTLDLDATVAYLKTLKAVRRDRIGVIGFCWGGGQSFRYATNNPALRAFVVCYGPGLDAAAIARIRARGLGVYAENDARIDAGLADVAAAVKQYAKDYRYTVYPGVGHGFLRSRERPEVADSAWGNVVRFFKESLER